MDIGMIQPSHAQLNAAMMDRAAGNDVNAARLEELREQVQSGEEQGETPESGELREAFDKFIGTTFYSQLIKSMRSTVGKPAYFHGGRAEEVFTAQLDQTLSEHMSEQTADQLSGPMFDLFMLGRP